MTRREHYRRIRAERPDTPARWAWDWAATRAEVDDLSARIEWDYTGEYAHGPMIVGRLDDVIEVRVYNDDEPYDPGDCELPEDDWRELEVIGVGVGIRGHDDAESVWGVAYLDHDATGNALTTAVECGFIDNVRRDLEARRETMTVRSVN